jgi:peptidoglycan-N-acetylglucosamine deacetylase
MEKVKNLPRWLIAIPLLLFVLFLLGSDGVLGAAPATHFSSGESCRRAVALTFDDGPNPPYTQRLLDILRANDATATFFVVGEAALAHPEVVREERDSGMAVGLHSYGHSSELFTMDGGEFRADLDQAEAAIGGILGYKPAFYRAPYGHTSETMLRELRAAGYSSVGWDVDSDDWEEGSADAIAQKVLAEAHPGAIVLLHDGGLGGGNPDRTATIEALAAILAGLRERGYEFLTVPEILDPEVCGGSSR